MNILNQLTDSLSTYFSGIIDFLPRLLVALTIVLLVYIIMRIIRSRLTRWIRNKSDDHLLVDFMDGVFKTLNFVLGFLLLLYLLGYWAAATSLIGGLGVSAFIIGFAFKDLGENFLAGVMMAFNRPFRMGDVVKTGDVEGTITEMSLRETHIKTFDGKDVYVPNGQILKAPLYNYTIDGFLRKEFKLKVPYRADMDKVSDRIKQILSEIPGVLGEEKAPTTFISSIDDGTVTFTIWFWFDTFDSKYSALTMQTQAIRDITTALEEMNIEIPGSVIDIRNHETKAIELKPSQGQKEAV